MGEQDLAYLSGFRNQLSSETLPGALPRGQNSPQHCPYGLYAEQLSGSAFTAPRERNLRSWLYRIRPSVVQSDYHEIARGDLRTGGVDRLAFEPTQLRWSPPPLPAQSVDFVQGLFTLAANGDVSAQFGCAAHLYAFDADMRDRYFYNADGEMLLVPQQGTLRLHTEMGVMDAAPGEITLIPRGVKFQVRLLGGAKAARGYVCENYGRPFELPQLGPIGANGLADPRDFLMPTAAYEEREGSFELIAKFGGRLWRAELKHSPLDVVAWHGNYAPCKYELARFNTINSVSFDHPDPSIFTVLTSASDSPGTANVDFVIFPPRWLVADHTFRPPYFHRNIMSECMGLIRGRYDAKAEGFVPGGASLHNCMSPHGPDADSYERAVETVLAPEYLGDTLAFMFESRYPFQLTEAALNASFRQRDYLSVWQGLRSRFDATRYTGDNS